MRAHAPTLPDDTDKRGFTVVEILVALSAGVLVATAAFALSKNATTFFQREARISSAQLALTLALNRLTGDIQRASYLSTSNIIADQNVCSTTKNTWPQGLSLLAGVNIAPGTQATPQSAAQTPPMTPDQIIIGGSMDTTEVWQVQSVTAGAGGAPLITFRAPATEPATMRAIASLGPTETLQSKITPIFYPTTTPASLASGRFAHLYLPDSNTHWYGEINTFTINPTTGAISVQLMQPPTLPTQPNSPCGIVMGATGNGWLFSVVSRVKYDIRSLSQATYAALPVATVVAPVAPQVTGDGIAGAIGRTELVRTELAADGSEIVGSTELVAEYAVDMRFGITVSTKVNPTSYSPTVTTYPFGDANVYTIAADIAHSGTPELIRAVQVRLSTRSRAPDRDQTLPTGPDGRSLRFLIDPTGAIQPPYARVRTVYANVALPNQGGFSLW